MSSVTYVQHAGSDSTVVNAARISMNKKSDTLTEKDKKLIKYLADHEHMCHDDATEVLTDRGWIYFKDVKPADKLAAVSSGGQDLTFTFETPERLVNYPFAGELYVCTSTHVDFAVTDNHRMWVSQRAAGGFKPFGFARADQLGDCRVLPSARLVRSGAGSRELGQLYGFYLGDGFEYSANIHAVRVKKQRKIDYLRECMAALRLEYSENVGEDQVTTFKWDRHFLGLSTGSGAASKQIDPSVWGAYSDEFLAGVLDGLKNSDGSVKRNAWHFCTISANLAVDFYRLATLCGKHVSQRPRKSLHTAFHFMVKSRSLSPRINDARLNNPVRTVPYTGIVYCATVSTGLLLTRRNGRTLVSGNSPFEHCTLTVKIDCPTYIAKQIMRHRTGAYNEVSRRYTSADITFFVPDAYRTQHTSNRQASAGPHPESREYMDLVEHHNDRALQLYNSMIKAGICREQARGVLPQDMLTSFFMTMNLRNFAHFVKLRTHEGAQYEVRLIADAVSCIMKDHFPVATECLLHGKKALLEPG